MMRADQVDRRKVLKGATALAGAGLLPHGALAQATPPQPRPADPPAALPARGEFVVRGALVLTMDPGLGELANGDVHVRNGAIVAVGAGLNAPAAEVIDGRGMICMPGFVETHWHLWTSACRRFVRAEVPQFEYFPVTQRLGQLFTPEDSYRGVRMGLSEALYSGITTVHNWAHNVRSPQHADAELRAMRDTGIRGRFSYGGPQAGPTDRPMDSADVARVKRDGFPGDGLLTLGICSRNLVPGQSVRGAISVEMAKRDWGAARELGIPITLHASPKGLVKMLDDAGLLGPDVQLVHPMFTSAEERAILAARGTSYSMSPLGESRRPPDGGEIQLGELMESGVKISMSIDHSTTSNCDCFSCMRTLYTLHQHRIGERIKLTTRRMVELATIDGARDLGIADKVGSLIPGKRADLILVRATDPNMAPLGDPFDALVCLAHPGNVDTVVVDGRVLRRNGRFAALDYEQVAREATESVAGLRARANWP
jgi:5-methylthioadenosine/S-adenosylhomocysteine deaminase